MKIVFRNTNVVFAAKKVYKAFSGSDNELANKYLKTIIITNDSGYTPSNHWKINNWINKTDIASWQIFDGDKLIATFDDAVFTETNYQGSKTTENGTFTLDVQGDIKGYKESLVAKAIHDNASYANGVNDLSGTINYFPNGDN